VNEREREKGRERRSEKRNGETMEKKRNTGSRVDPAYGQHRSARAPCQETANGP